MNPNIVQLERTFDAPVSVIWKALTDKNEMKKWYFDLEEFKPEVGFKFSFLAGKDCDNQFLHLCEVTEVIPEQKLTYSWAYDGYPGLSHVTFELTPEAGKTHFKLTHLGLETFPQTEALAISNFRAGWSSFINNKLEQYVAAMQ